MALYVFYLRTSEGLSNSLEVVSLATDDEVPEQAVKLLADHPSCAYAEVWEGDRRVVWQRREDAVSQTEEPHT